MASFDTKMIAMTNTTEQHAGPAFEGPRAIFASAMGTAAAAIDRVVPEQFGAPTPCSELDVRDLISHLLAVAARVSAVGRGLDAMSTPDMVAAANDDWSGAWKRAIGDYAEAWRDDSTLEQIVVLPWATLPGSEFLAMYASETSMASMVQHLPAEGRVEAFEAFRATMSVVPADWNAPYANAVAVADDAKPIDRLVAWTGRTP
ncbi:MAG: hypothetical protein FD127_3397 [Acidimicrobiaceae bacterium]|nr:MAG: hypothetical protein FD127_3397 [Acidimicrobiaceae bacterium]